ncbi:hypothetical protein LPJ63_000053 [Coemansia sp. RSA 2711]|nr:hypothetical protein LPJ63_000053 [Coemansia sp. RSA 2711]KAJ1846952.1 hypothetical protein LPJ70_001776 [Coemansia sp. RSA 2708]KAJ2363526.1 hypothetical protein H4S01_004256 [Coemansia sp. RSA 2610]KAJ2383387.1 hypothetical protein H4S02_005324 [Coemansia sp. RSA 2611]KAJ2734326.1 hypothetical protein H4R23_002440 [Coemansia sp. Cherry 401B]
MATPLFSQQPQRGGAGAGGRGGTVAGALVEFKAGRLFRDGATNWVRPDARRGVCYVRRDDEGLMYFCWKERQGGAQPEEELIVFSGDVRLEKVQQSSGRVYVLKFQSSSQRVFFWLQEPDAAGDSRLIGRVNAVLDDKGEDEEEEARTLLRQDSQEAEALSRHREQSALARESSELSRDALASTQVGGVPASMRRVSQQNPGDDVQPMGERAAAGLGPGQLGSLRELLSSIQVPEGYAGASAASAAEQVHLADVLTPENLRAVLEDERLRHALFPTLPDEIPRSQRALGQIIRSAQFQQALNSLSYVLESGQMAALVTQLGLDAEAGTSVAAFLQAIQEQLKREQDEDEEMQ